MTLQLPESSNPILLALLSVVDHSFTPKIGLLALASYLIVFVVFFTNLSILNP